MSVLAPAPRLRPYTDLDAKLDGLLRRAQAEMADVDLFAPPPPNEDCPICFLPYPRDETLSVFSTCCGKITCSGCVFKRAQEIGGRIHICAFCRTPPARGLNHIKALEKQMQKQNPRAFMEMAREYSNGDVVPQNERKALEMFAEAANLGYYEAYSSIRNEDMSKSRAFLEIAAKKGSATSHRKLAELNEGMGNVGLAIKHHKVAACAGIQSSLTALIKAFKDDVLSKEELEHCLRAFQTSDGEMKSKDRDAYLAYREEHLRL